MNTLSSAAWDVNSLNSLRLATSKQPQQQAAAVAKQVEGLFLQMMLKSMRQSLPGSDLLGSDQQRLFTSLYDQQLSQMNTQRGLGLAALIEKQMQPQLPPSQDVGEKPLPLGPERVAALPFATGIRRTFDQFTPLSGPIAEFIRHLLPHARAVSRTSGIPEKLMLAQAALESGWGQRQILTAQGRPSHNLFGIKAGRHWQGPTTDTLTTEYQHGQAQKVTDKFRVYASLRDALNDYAALLVNNPRYKPVVSAKTAEQGAFALQASGYASDPHYAKKLLSILRQLDHTSVHSDSLSEAFTSLF